MGTMALESWTSYLSRGIQIIYFRVSFFIVSNRNIIGYVFFLEKIHNTKKVYLHNGKVAGDE